MAIDLLVEGTDDRHLVRNVARDYGLDLDSENIRDCGGIDRLLNDILPVALKSTVRAIGVVVDADLDLNARWQAIANRVKAGGYAVPAQPNPDGLILTDKRPAVGVWIMPDNSLAGSLEDFAAQLIPEGDGLWPRARGAVEEIPPADRRFNPAAVRKAEVSVYRPN